MTEGLHICSRDATIELHILRRSRHGLDVADQRPQRLTTELAGQADAVVLPHPKVRPIEQVRATRGDIMRRVQALVHDLDGETGSGP